MKLNHVLVVFKRQSVEGSPLAGRRAEFKTAHNKAILDVENVLRRQDIGYSLVERNDLKAGLCGDLIVAVGGDGTVLASAHVAGDTPILGVCSMPGFSVGFFCSAGVENFEEELKDISSGKMEPVRLPLIEARIGSAIVSPLALNDVLFASASPAEMARYEIEIAGRKESQRSSGVWFCAGPGSTAAMRSAGGRQQKINSRSLQYIVREPYSVFGRRYKMRKGLLKEGEDIKIVPEMNGTAVFIDGHKCMHPVPCGAVVSLQVSEKTLAIFV